MTEPRPAVEEGPRDDDIVLWVGPSVECGVCGARADMQYEREIEDWKSAHQAALGHAVYRSFGRPPAARPLVQEDDPAPSNLEKQFQSWQRDAGMPADDPRDEDDDVETARRAFLTSLWPDYDSNRDAYEHTLRVAALNNYVAAIERRRGVAE